MSRMLGGNGETAVLHVERANSADEDSTQSAGSPISRMPQKQKAGYRQHASPTQLYSDHASRIADSEILNVAWSMKRNGLRDATIKNVIKALKYLLNIVV